ncbi:conserved hypothetical protein [Hyphomonas neptunium ATCC 15444]|uniref:7-cyano-7-deazaguanine synthase n=3 Tax=Hyphomonadaceae TaxID=69657 RepID=Q0C5H6_HYPNA|nr:conserved hypothetical protein [Hyphomonas neptunium ATCC 15444]KCZ95451.1 hypothetical protein HHI_04825 [Hyphomonas hirschiana VP5]
MVSDYAIERPDAHVYVCSDGEAAPEHSALCVLGRHLKLEPRALGTFLMRSIPARAEDLLVLAGAVAYIDRLGKRHHSKCWERDLFLSLPVRDFDFWDASDLRDELKSLLEMLTGDSWYLEFRPGRAPLPVDRQGSLSLTDTPPVVIPYSNGLDSFAVARLHAQPRQHIIRVSTGRVGDTEKKVSHARTASTRWVSMPISLPGAGVRLPEQSYRSRGFLFGAVAATAAGIMKGAEIVVPESGQGTFGPALTVIGHEHPDVRMSPIFTSALGRFVSRIFESPIRFVHPRVWSTKGETLAALQIAQLSEGWEVTVSCSRSSRRKIQGSVAKHCGVCANCLLRRQSLQVAGLVSSSQEPYIWPDLGQSPPWTSRDHPVPGKSVVQQAISAILAMRDFAMISPESPLVLREAAAIAEALGEPRESTLHGMHHVMAKHREEWSALLSTFPPTSLFRALGAVA